MTKRITSEDCEGNIEDIEEGRYNSHVVPVSAEDDPGYEEIDYGDCTQFTVPLGRYGSHVVPIGGSSSGGGGGGSTDPINLDGYYTKEEVDALLDGLDLEVDLSDYYNKTEIDALIADYYTKAEIDAKFDTLDTTIDLEKVLDNGNVADKDIVLTDAVDDLIDISPTEGRIVIASDTDAKTPKLTLAHFGDHNDGNRKADIELDENGTRLDFEMSTSVKDIHFRFGDDEKFIINHEGDAEFVGKVKVEPGTEGNEAVTFGQIATLEAEIEQLKPSLERGPWNWTNAEVPGPGEYSIKRDSDPVAAAQCDTALQECLYNAGGDAAAGTQCNRDHKTCTDQAGEGVDPDFSKAYTVTFNKKDSLGTDHTFSDVEVGMYLDIFNEEDDGFLLGDITAIVRGTNISFLVTPVQSRGLASGLGRVKVFEVNDSVVEDLTSYVRKTGDEMSGMLTVKPTSGNYGLVVLPGPDASGTTDIFRVRSYDDKQMFYVDVSGGVGVSTSWTPSKSNHLITKKYLDGKTANVPVGPGAPGGMVVGDMWFDTNTNSLMIKVS